MLKKGSAILLAVGVFTASCDVGKSQPDSAVPKTVTNEELRLWDIGQVKSRFATGQIYRIVGKILSIGITDDGSPLVSFLGVDARFPRDFDRKRLEVLVPNLYVAVDCQVKKADKGAVGVLAQCTRIDDLPQVSADEYKATYDRNLFKADSIFKDKYVVIDGIVRQNANLTSGEYYISFVTQNGFSDVVAITDPEDRSLARDYYKVGARAAILCLGGTRWNEVNSIGLKSCRVISN